MTSPTIPRPSHTVGLPPRFVERMRDLLGEDAGRLVQALTEAPVAGLRVNTGKLTPDAFRRLSPWALEPVPWCTAGFVLADAARPGKHPFHAAGLYYLQEPSAMSVVEALDVQPGHLVLDLAAAPGGKATHITAKLAGTGVLVANEMVASRIKPLGENLERCGVTNAILVNEEPARLVDRLGPAFDRVLLDAPCSGEGMFRKSPAAIREWSPEHVAGSAARQAKILIDAARLVRPGGLLLYSTCTFAPEENEVRIAAFLASHPGWTLEDVPKSGGMEPARPEWSGTASPPPLERAARLWPHLVTGEGHFLALLRAPAGDEVASASRSRREPPDTASTESWRRFAAESLQLGRDASPIGAALAHGDRLHWQGPHGYLVPDHDLAIDGLRVVRPGLPLGEAKPGRFEPSHALALALGPGDAERTMDLAPADAERYLAGEQLTAPGEPGWILVTVEGWPLGWGRRSGDAVKNHYPKGLRRPLS